MKLNPALLYSSPLIIAIVLVSFMAIKIFIIYFLAVRAGESKKDAWASAFMLAQMGEFGFVLISLSFSVGVLDYELTSILLGSGIISMAITPYMIKNARKWGVKLAYGGSYRPTDNQSTEQASKKLENHVVICGFGRVGQTVSRFLKREGIRFVAIDIDPVRVQESRDAGEHVLFGSARQPELLDAANIEKAKLVVISYGSAEQSLDVVQKVRSLSRSVNILVRTRNDDALKSLREAGANEVVPESLEGSLMLVSQVLNLTGVPFGKIIRLIKKERKNHYNQLHGFYPGVDTNMSAATIDRIQFVHATLLTDNAWAIGRSVKDLHLEKRRVELLAVHREDNELVNVSADFILQAQDTIVLQGKPRRIERIERLLQEGA